MIEKKSKLVMTGFKMPAELVKKMDDYSYKTGTTKTYMVIEGLKLYFKARGV